MKKNRKEVAVSQSRGYAKKLGMADRIIALVEEARGKVAKAANVALVYTYYEVGRMIVEDEQGGKRRAAYGKAQLADLSRKLTERFGKGWSVPNLKLMRQLFVVYSNSINSVYPIANAERSKASVLESKTRPMENQNAVLRSGVLQSDSQVLRPRRSQDRRAYARRRRADDDVRQLLRPQGEAGR